MQVEAGVRIIGEAAWRNCQRLQIVHLSSAVICLQNRVFRRCYALRTVLAPGCKQFGIKVFEECCSLMQIGTNSETTNQLAPQAQLMPRAFEKCTAMRPRRVLPDVYLNAVFLRLESCRCPCRQILHGLDLRPVNDVCNCSVLISDVQRSLRSWVLPLRTVNTCST